MRPTSTYAAGDTVGLYALGDNSGSRIFVGAGNNSSGLAYGVGSGSLTENFNFSAASTLPAAGSTVFLVLRLDRIDAINTTATFYLNPTPGRTLPDVGAVGSYTYNTGNLAGLGILQHTSSAATVFDEIRLGSSYSSVAPGAESERTIHSVDSNQNFRIELVELTRMIELYNTRRGTLRTGRYVAATGTVDGFSPDPTAPGGAAVLTRYHSADTNRDGRLDLVEITRVIELYGTRSETTRTGVYHAVAAGTEDGFAAGP